MKRCIFALFALTACQANNAGSDDMAVTGDVDMKPAKTYTTATLRDVDLNNVSTGVRTLVFSAPVTAALTTSDTITVTFPSQATIKAASALSVSGLLSVGRLDVTSNGSGGTTSGTGSTGTSSPRSTTSAT